MNQNTLVSLIVSTYNRPDALSLVLAGCGRQTDPRFEVIVADDGSTDATRGVVDEMSAKLRVPVEHVWHADEGFRLAAIRNKGIKRARGEYLIFLDGDCVPQPDFVARHRQLAQRGAMVTGSRILLGPELTAAAIGTRFDVAGASVAFWVLQRLRGQANKVLPLFVKLPDFSGRRVDGFKWRGIKGCNLAAWSADVATVNGFDESFTGWGHEDADFVARLHNAGVARKKGFMATEVLHLWHREQARDNENPNRQRVLQRLADGHVEAERGLAQMGVV